MAEASRRLSTTTRPQQDVLPASQYLQDRLQERRARNTRPHKARQSDFGPRTTTSARDDDIFITEGDSKPLRSRPFDSSPLTAHKYEVEDSRSRAIGSRQLDEQIDRLNKENFHLKLEIDHRRAREHKLNAEVEHMRDAVRRAEELQDEHTELMRINTDLVQELEKRDEAIQQAVDIITELEEKIEELEDDRHSVTRASTIQADSGYAGTETQEAAPMASPAEALLKAGKAPVSPVATRTATRDLHSILSDSPSKSSRRPPTFMSQDKPATEALRTVFLKNARQLHPVKSFQSILSKHTSTIDDEDGALHSPRFSSLSESSFSSMYNPKKPSPDRHAWEPVETTPSYTPVHGAHGRQASISRVSQWIEGHNTLSATPSKSSLAAPVASGSSRTATPTLTTVPAREHQSIRDALASPLFDPVDLLRPDPPQRSHTAHPLSDSRRNSRTPTSFGGPIFGEPLLTPGSDTASQRLLRSSRSTIIAEKSIVDNASSYASMLDSSLRTAPKQMRSSIELNTAFVSNLEYRKTGLSNVHHAEEQSPSDDETSLAMRDYFGYPDGNSILCGTPSRFIKHIKPPAGDMFFDGNDLSSPEAARKSSHRRRKSSGGHRARKPNLTRAETTPNMPLLTTDLPVRTVRGDVTSPISFQSTSSNRTAYSKQDARRPLSPEALSPPRKPPSRGVDRVAASPARPSLTQKTQQLFRRLSSSHGSDRTPEPRDQAMPTPVRPALPTLTSTPSSAYVNVIPKEMRRANGAQSIDASIKQAQPTSVQTPTPSLTRTSSELRNITTTTAPLTDSAVEKKGFFGRRGSFKSIGLERSKTVNTSNRGRRRSSVKDTLKAGRPWV